MISFLLAMVLQPARSQTVLLAGDIMLNGIGVKQKPLEKLGRIFVPAGVALANLEIPLTNAKETTPNKPAEDVAKRNQFILKADPLQAPGIASAGIRMVSLGNNHCMDYRKAGLQQMEAALTKNHIDFAGAGSSLSQALAPAVYIDRDGRRIGLISALAFIGSQALDHCTPARAASAGVATLNFGGILDDKATKRLAIMFADAKTHCDLLIVGLHWGIERQTVPTSYQVNLGRACVDAGADIVWGNHPHVLQGAELYKGKPILYSMGNLIFSKGGPTGVVKLVYVSAKYDRAQFFPLSISNERVLPVTGAPAKSAIKSYKNLCLMIQKRFPSKESKPLL